MNIPKEDASKQCRRPLEVPWTASRCVRALRQLQALLRRMERWHRDYHQTASATNGTHDDSCHDADTTTSMWLQTTSNTVVACYGARSKPKLPITPKSGKLRILNRSRSDVDGPAPPETPNVETPLCTPYSTIGYTVRAQPVKVQHEPTRGRINGRRGKSVKHQYFRQCRHEQAYPPFSFDLSQRNSLASNSYEYIAVDAEAVITTFLLATSDEEGPTTWKGCQPRGERGTKSLLQTCLGKLAKDKVEEQVLHEATSDRLAIHNDFMELLDELEGYFGDSKHGWRHLRFLARHYGIAAICRSIRAGHLKLNLARDLAARTFRFPSMSDAGEEMIEYGLVPAQAVTRPDVGHGDIYFCYGMPAFAALAEYRHGPRDWYRKSFKLRMIGKAYQNTNESLPLEWMFHRRLLCRIVKHLDQSVNARNLVYHVYVRALDLNDQRVDERHASLRTRLRGDLIPFVHGDVRNCSWESQMTRKLREGITQMLFMGLSCKTSAAAHVLNILTVQVQRKIELSLWQSASTDQQDVIGILLVGRLLLLLRHGIQIPHSLSTQIANLLEEQQFHTSMVKQIAATLCSICCLYEETVSATVQPEQLITALLHASENQSSLSRFLRMVLRDAALLFAMRGSDRTRIEWATQLQQRVQDTTNSSNETFMPYHWDDTLEEWVEKTPSVSRVTIPVRKPGPSDMGTSTKRLSLVPSRGPVVKCLEQNQKRGHSQDGWHEHSDGDFIYKKRRVVLGKQETAMRNLDAGDSSSGDSLLLAPIGRRMESTRNRYRPQALHAADSDESEDELSMLL